MSSFPEAIAPQELSSVGNLVGSYEQMATNSLAQVVTNIRIIVLLESVQRREELLAVVPTVRPVKIGPEIMPEIITLIHSARSQHTNIAYIVREFIGPDRVDRSLYLELVDLLRTEKGKNIEHLGKGWFRSVLTRHLQPPVKLSKFGPDDRSKLRIAEEKQLPPGSDFWPGQSIENHAEGEPVTEYPQAGMSLDDMLIVAGIPKTGARHHRPAQRDRYKRIQ